MEHRFISKKYWKKMETLLGGVVQKAGAYDDCINLSIGDPDILTPSVIIENAFEDARNGHTKYTDGRGYPELRQEICKFYKEEYDMDVDDSEVIVVASGVMAMFEVMQTVLDEGDEVLIQSPCFSPYFRQVTMAGGIPVEMPTYEEEDFQINLDRLESMITPKTKVLLINSPSNPTGNCLSLETMGKLAEIVTKHDLLVVCDDIYTAFSFQEKFIPFASLPGMRKRTIIINSFSKNFLMTGWRIGNVIAPSFIIDVMKDIHENVIFTAPSISQRGAIHALRHRHEVQPPIIEEYKKRMDYAAERINQIPWMSVLTPPKGSFYLFINIKNTGLTSNEASEMLLEKAHVLLLPGSSFGKCGEGFLRLCCTVGIDKLKEAFDRIEKIEL